jgi:hypothetical protein
VRRGAQKKWGIDHIFGRHTEIAVAGKEKNGVFESWVVRKQGGPLATEYAEITEKNDKAFPCLPSVPWLFT